MNATKTNADNLERLQKVLAAAGIGSRRQCEELILEGRVDVDREVVTKLGTRVDPDAQAIRVDGVPLKKRRRQYFAVHKPPGVVSTSADQWRRTRVIDLVSSKDRVFTIGRLDKDSSGLILVTNDGELANRLTHPRYQVPKTYHVTVAGTPNAETLQKLRRGIVLWEGRVKPYAIKINKRLKQSTLLEIVLTEGRNREIRRMLARFEHKVLTLHRVAIGPVRLGELPKAAHRELSRDEVKKLQNFDNEAPKRSRRKKSSPKRETPKTARAKAKKKTKAIKQAKKQAKKTTKRSKSAFDASPKMGAVLGGGGGESTKKTKKKSPRRTKRKR